MKVLYFSYAYPNSTQPTLGTFNRSLLAALSSQHDIRVVARDRGKHNEVFWSREFKPMFEWMFG